MANKKLKERIFDYCNKLSIENIWISEDDGIVFIEDYYDEDKEPLLIPTSIRTLSLDMFCEMMIEKNLYVSEIKAYSRNLKIGELI